jgi:hypothetical protein
MPDKKQAALLNLLGIEMTCKNMPKRSSLARKPQNST